MHLDLSRFPLVFLRSDAPSDASPELQIEGLLDGGAPFVLISDRVPDKDHHETPEERKQHALFFKRNKDRLRALCRGIVVVEGDKVTPMPIRLAAQAVGKAFGAGVAFAPDEAGAVEAGMMFLREGS